MWGERQEDIGGTELSAEFQFSSLQKFGQGFLKKLKGKRIPNQLLERVRAYLMQTLIRVFDYY